MVARNIGERVVGDTIGGAAFGEDPSQPQLPWWAKASQTMPGTLVSTGMTGFRGSNTIIRGGWGPRKGRITGRMIDPTKKGWRSTIRNNNPFTGRSWTRYGSQEIFHGEDAAYTPFQFIDKSVNWAGRKFGKGAMFEDGADALSKGTYSRISAGARISQMGGMRYAGAAKNASHFLKGAGFSDAHVAALNEAGPRAMGQAVMMSGNGTVSNFVGGFLSGASRGGVQEATASVIAERASVQGVKGAGARAAVKGATYAANWGRQAAEKAGVNLTEKLTTRAAAKMIFRSGSIEMGAKGAAYAGSRALPYLIPGLNVAAAIWTAYDISKTVTQLTGSAIKGSVKLAADSFRSYRGGMNTPIMGTGFKDNEMTISSRQRGVAAIQNSRLNARSVLGSEAGPMAAHFGYSSS